MMRMASDSGLESVQVDDRPDGARRLVFTGPELAGGRVVINLDRVASTFVSKALAPHPEEADRA